MSSELNALAINQILAFTEAADDELSQELRMLCLDGSSQTDRRRLERRLILQNTLKEKDVKDIFAHGKPLVFDGEDYPRLLVPTIVEAFRQLTNEPSFLDITIAVPTKGFDAWFDIDIPVSMDPTMEVWRQAYDTFLPCDACRTVEKSRSWRIKRFPSWDPSIHPRLHSAQYAIEKFHVASRHFDTNLDVDLHFILRDLRKFDVWDFPVYPPTAPNIWKAGLHKVTMRVVDGGCRDPTHEVTRKSKTILLISDFALEVYGFADRVHVGSSLIASRGLNEQIIKLQRLLPVHHLLCEFEETRPTYTTLENGVWINHTPEEYWLVLQHFRRDLTYTDIRRFRVPSTAGSTSTAADCALILCYLSNSHVTDFEAPHYEPRFTFKMLAALVDRNFSMGRMRMRVLDNPLTDYRSLDAVFRGGMQLDSLYLWIHEDRLNRLIKTTDFFCLPVIQRLKEFKLRLITNENPESSTRRQHAVISSPLWTAGVHLLRNCELNRVEWQWPARTDRSVPSVRSKRHLKSIALKLVQICEAFERGEVPEIVANSVFRFPTRLAFPFKTGNKTASGIMIEMEQSCRRYMWDVYRFRNAATGEWLTACVGHSGLDWGMAYSMLHIVKGEVFPDATYSREF